MVCLQSEARRRAVGCSSEREGEGLQKQTQKGGSLQCLSSNQAYLLSWKIRMKQTQHIGINARR